MARLTIIYVLEYLGELRNSWSSLLWAEKL